MVHSPRGASPSTEECRTHRCSGGSPKCDPGSTAAQMLEAELSVLVYEILIYRGYGTR